MSVSKRLRFEILRRDNHACRYCGASAPDAKLTVDHVVPTALGGSDEPANLVAACVDCNAGKSSVPADAPVVADVQADALRWARAMDIAAQGRRVTLAEQLEARALFAEIWNNWTYEWKGERKTVPLPARWEDSIDRFVDAGLEEAEFREAVRIAMTRTNRDEFKYMCGVIWRWIGEQQDIAMKIASTDPGDAEL